MFISDISKQLNTIWDIENTPEETEIIPVLQLLVTQTLSYSQLLSATLSSKQKLYVMT